MGSDQSNKLPLLSVSWFVKAHCVQFPVSFLPCEILTIAPIAELQRLHTGQCDIPYVGPSRPQKRMTQEILSALLCCAFLRASVLHEQVNVLWYMLSALTFVVDAATLGCGWDITRESRKTRLSRLASKFAPNPLDRYISCDPETPPPALFLLRHSQLNQERVSM
jgi:hypothetical protein